MKTLNKTHLAGRDALSSRFQAAKDSLQAAAEAFNGAVEEAWANVEEAKAAYNEVIADANSWKEDIVSEIQSYMDGHSEKWQDSDKAEEYVRWKEQFEEIIEDLELDQPEPIDLDIDDHSEVLDQLPEEV